MSVSLLDLHRSGFGVPCIKCWHTFVIDRCGLTLGGQLRQLRNSHCISQNYIARVYQIFTQESEFVLSREYIRNFQTKPS